VFSASSYLAINTCKNRFIRIIHANAEMIIDILVDGFCDHAVSEETSNGGRERVKWLTYGCK